MDSATDLIQDYSLVQVTETGSSVAMEKGLRCCLDKFLAQGVEITSITTDRHIGVASWMKKEYPFIDHQYDMWHTYVKKLTKQAKGKIVGSF